MSTLAALDANSWRRRDTAQYLGIRAQSVVGKEA
jgi:hypothetical protein